MQNSLDYLQKKREKYLPTLPLILRDLSHLRWEKHAKQKVDASIAPLFPHTCDQSLMTAVVGQKRDAIPLKVGVFFSGGQAPGGHNVITGMHDALAQLSKKFSLIGFLGGPEGLIQGDFLELISQDIQPYRNQGGFDLIGSGRSKIETDEQLEAAHQIAQQMGLDGVVVIGGDDSNTNAAVLAEYFLAHGCKTKVIGVPKTIDGDLQNEHVLLPFGFDTACRIYSELISNIARDALSARKYYHFIKLMGRSASHIALECALQTHPTWVLIGEEIAQQKQSLSAIVGQLCDLIEKREKLGKHFGIFLFPEGAIEFIPEIQSLIGELNILLHSDHGSTEILNQLTPPAKKCFDILPEKTQNQLLFHRDPHGNIQVSLIETERLFIELVEKELKKRKKGENFSPLPHFFGYEGRAGFPTNFDSTYCYALGHVAIALIQEEMTGYMACVTDLAKSPHDWGAAGVPLTSLMSLEMRKGKEKPVIQKKLVDLKGPPFTHFKAKRERWALEDDFHFPGPIQFDGDPGAPHWLPLSSSMES